MVAEQLTYNQKDAARRMGVSPKTFRRWKERGFIVPIDIGGVQLYGEDDLEDLRSRARAGKLTGKQ